MGFLWQQNFFFNLFAPTAAAAVAADRGVWRVLSVRHGTWTCLGIRESLPNELQVVIVVAVSPAAPAAVAAATWC